MFGDADNNALSKVVNRTVEVDDEEWATLHKHSKNHAKPPEDQKHKRFVQRCANLLDLQRLLPAQTGAKTCLHAL